MTIAEIAGKVDSLTPAYCHLLKHTWDLNPTAFARAGNNLIVGFLDQTGIYTSSDNGDKWTKRWSPSGDNPMIYCMVKYGSTMLAGTASGLLRSTGQGLTWDYIQNDVLDYDVTSLLVGPDDVLQIGTGVLGMYSSSDGGETLEPHNDGAGDNNCVTTIARDGGKLFAGWNYYNTDWWFQLEWMPRSWCHLLWSETPSNLHNSNDRGKSAKAPAALGLAKPRRF